MNVTLIMNLMECRNRKSLDEHICKFLACLIMNNNFFFFFLTLGGHRVLNRENKLFFKQSPVSNLFVHLSV